MHSITRDLFYSVFPNSIKYLTYGVGNIPIILSAPHGGGIKPLSIPYRKYGNRGRDSYTRRLIQKVIELLDKPYYVYSDIHRSRVDLNRDIEEAAQGNRKAELIWTQWNNKLNEFTSIVKAKHGKGLYVDIHSHNNSDKFQIGYGLSVNEYNDIRVGWEINDKSTMYAFRDGNSEFPALFGEFSFPHNLEVFGYEVLIPEAENKYLNGGRNIYKFSDKSIGAIQIECPIPVLRKDLNGVAVALANSIEIFRNNLM